VKYLRPVNVCFLVILITRHFFECVNRFELKFLGLCFKTCGFVVEKISKRNEKKFVRLQLVNLE